MSYRSVKPGQIRQEGYIFRNISPSSLGWNWLHIRAPGPSTLATLFNHMWPRIVADPSTLGRHVCYVCKRSVCGGDEPQPVAHLSHKLQCARQSLKIMVSYGNKYPRHNTPPHVVEQSGQWARALTDGAMLRAHTRANNCLFSEPKEQGNVTSQGSKKYLPH